MLVHYLRLFCGISSTVVLLCLSACSDSNGDGALPSGSYEDLCKVNCGFGHAVGPDLTPPAAVPVTAVPHNGFYQDPNTGVFVRRISDKTNLEGVERLRHFYAKSNPYNADSSLALLTDSKNRYWLQYTSDNLPVKQLQLDSANTEVYWHPVDPWVLYALDYSSDSSSVRGIYFYNVVDDTKTLLRDFPEYTQALTFGEGNMDASGRYLALAGLLPSSNSEEERYELFVYDVLEDRVLARTPIDASEVGDWVSITPNAGFVVAMGDNYSSVYDRDLNLLYKLEEGSFGHGDLCVRSDGAEVLVYDGADNSLDGNRNFNVVDLASGVTYGMFRFSWALTPHVSCRNVDKPGWALISMMGVASNDYSDVDEGLFWLKLDGSGDVFPIVNHYSDRAGGYFAESHAVSNRDGSRVMFASDWRGSTSPSSYQVTLTALE